MEKSGWESLPSIKREYTFYYPRFHWWQFIKKRKHAKLMRLLTPGARIKVKRPNIYMDDFTVETIVKIKEQ